MRADVRVRSGLDRQESSYQGLCAPLGWRDLEATWSSAWHEPSAGVTCYRTVIWLLLTT
jgi:hypothetical protein